MSLDFSKVLEDEALEPQVVDSVAPATLSLTTIKFQLAKYDQQLDDLVAQAKALKVVDEATRAEGVDIAATLKKIDGRIEDERKRVKAPALEFGKSVDNLAHIYQTKCREGIAAIKNADRSFQAHLDMENARLKREQDEANRKMQEAVDAKAKELGVEAPKVETPAFVPLPKAVKTEAGSISYREVWKWEVVDIALVGRKYLMVNDKLINQDVKGGLREAPGLRIWLDKEPVLR